MFLLTRLRRRRAEIKLAIVDAEIARWYVYDGQLSARPLKGGLSGVNAELRLERLEAVAQFERHGGRDPWPTVFREPTDEQRAAHA